jgi:type IV secretory pathway TrbD component
MNWESLSMAQLAVLSSLVVVALLNRHSLLRRQTLRQQILLLTGLAAGISIAATQNWHRVFVLVVLIMAAAVVIYVPFGRVDRREEE